MHVAELNYDELKQLKEELYFCDEEYLPSMNVQQIEQFESAHDIDDIPDEFIFGLYNGEDFPKDYFWCNV